MIGIRYTKLLVDPVSYAHVIRLDLKITLESGQTNIQAYSDVDFDLKAITMRICLGAEWIGKALYIIF